MTFHYVLKMAIAQAYFEMSALETDKILREHWLNKLVEHCHDS